LLTIAADRSECRPMLDSSTIALPVSDALASLEGMLCA
jgi:hypothetical protein